MYDLNVFSKITPYSRYNIFGKIKWFFKSLKWAWQRAVKGYCEYDLWDLDNYYLNLLSESLKDFTKNLHGAPQEFFDDEADGKDQLKPWIDYINETATHFKNAIITYDETFEETEAKEKELKKGLEMLSNQFHNLWD